MRGLRSQRDFSDLSDAELVIAIVLASLGSAHKPVRIHSAFYSLNEQLTDC